MRPTNRKIIIAFLLICLLLAAISSTQIDYSKASDKINDYEYYYTDTENENGGSAVSDYSSAPDTNEVLELPAKTDTTPDSITVLVNKSYPLSKDYVPEDLTVPDIPFHEPEFDEKKQLRAVAADAIEKLFAAAEESGLSLYGVSGYRSYERQNEIYTNNLRTKGISHTQQYSAKPGYSEHQTGLAMDISTASIHYSLDDRFSDTPEGEWISKNAHLYGFIVRYPEDKSFITEYAYEPWHIRYVGVELATLLYKNNLTLDEYYGYTPDPEKNGDVPDTLDVDTDDVDTDSINTTSEDTNREDTDSKGNDKSDNSKTTGSDTPADASEASDSSSGKNNKKTDSSKKEDSKNKNSDKKNSNTTNKTDKNSPSVSKPSSGKEPEKNTEQKPDKNTGQTQETPSGQTPEGEPESGSNASEETTDTESPDTASSPAETN